MTSSDDIATILDRLQEINFCSSPVWLESVDSTSNYLKRNIQTYSDQQSRWFDFVGATHQFAGRGTGSKNWYAGKGNLTFSFWVPSEILPENACYLLGVFTGIVLARTLRKLVSADVRMKWPNDLLIGERKVAGILIETASYQGIALQYEKLNQVSRKDGFVVGVGLNVDSSPRSDVVTQATVYVNKHSRKELRQIDCLLAFANQWVLDLSCWQSMGHHFIDDRFGDATKFSHHQLCVQTGKGERIGRFARILSTGELRLLDVCDDDAEFSIRPDEIREIRLLGE